MDEHVCQVRLELPGPKVSAFLISVAQDQSRHSGIKPDVLKAKLGEAEGPAIGRELSADVAWMHRNPAAPGASYLLKIGTREVKASILGVEAAYDVTTGGEIVLEGRSLGLNDLGRVKVRTSEPIAFDPYATDRTTGSFLLVDPTSGDTLAAGMVREAL